MTDLATYFAFTGGSKAAEADWSTMGKLWATDGVVRSALSEFLVQATVGPSLNVNVLAGQAWVQGDFGAHGATLTFAVTPDPTNPRKDIVVLRNNYGAHKMEALYITGTPAGSPVPPNPTHNPGVTWDTVLAEISVAAAAASITNANITDRRPWTSAGGITRAANVASVSPLIPPVVDQVPQSFMILQPVTGTTGFNTIQAPLSGAFPILILEFAGVLTVTTDSGNLRLGRNLTTQAGTILALEWDGTVWRELYRDRETIAANLVLVGPASGGAAEPSYRGLAELDFPAALWTTANPTLLFQPSTGTTITFTTGMADLIKMGKFFTYVCQIALTSNGGGLAPFNVQLTLPFTTAALANTPLGTFVYLNAASGIAYSGVVAILPGAANKVVFLNGTALVPTSSQPVIGESLLFSISGKLA